MAEVPRLRIPSPAPPAGRNTAPLYNAGDTASAAFRWLQQLSSQVDGQLDRQAAQEGEQAGGLAGLDPAFRPTGDATIRAEAYDRAGLRTALARLETDQSAKADALWQANQSDPAALAKAFDTAAAEGTGALTGGLDALKPQLAIGWERLKRARLAEAAVQQERTMHDADRAAVLAQIDARTKRIEQLAYSTDPMADEAVKGELAGFQELLAEHGPREAFTFNGRKYAADPGRGGSFGLDDIQQILLRTTDNAVEARVKGRFDLVRGSGGQQNFRNRFMADYKSGKVSLTLQQSERLADFMDSTISHSRVEERAASEGLRQQVSASVDLLKNGYKPALDLDRLETAARQAGRPDLVSQIGQARVLFDFQSKVRTQPPAAIDAWLGAERARLDKAGATPFERTRFEMTQSVRDAMVRGIKTNVLDWAAGSGVAPVAPLDMRTDKAGAMPGLAASLGRRAALSDALAQKYGSQPHMLRDGERDALSARLTEATPPQKVAILSALTTGLDGRHTEQMVRELSGDHPALAQAALLMRAGNGEAAMRIATGMAAPKGSEEVPRAKADAVSAPLLSALPENQTTARSAVRQAAEAIYTSYQAAKGKAGWDEDLYSQALDEAVGARYANGRKVSGGFGRVNGANVVLPSDMTERDVERTLDALSDADLPAISEQGAAPKWGGSKAKVTAADIRDAYPVTLGNGLYAFSRTDPGKGHQELIGAETPRGVYVVDIAAARKRISGRPVDSRYRGAAVTGPGFTGVLTP